MDKIQIKSKKLLLVEGKDEESFFSCWLKQIGIEKEIQIIPCGGQEQFQNKIPVVKKAPGFNEVKSLVVIRDADDNANDAFKSVSNTLKKNKLNAPDKSGEFKKVDPKIGIFILPDGITSGMLESVCLSTVESKEILGCIDFFMDCIKKHSENSPCYKKPKNELKARLRAFLASREEDCSSLGIAAKKGYFNFQSPQLKSLSSFLKEI